MLVPTDADTLDPRHATDAVALRTTRLLHAGLVRLDPDTLEPKPYLAKGWTWLDPLTLRVELRDDVRFHSGAAFGSRDVAATVRAFASPEVGSRHARVIEAIGEVDAPSEHVAVFHLKRPHATLLTDLELPILRADEAASPPRPDGSLDGLGPFRVVGRAPGEIDLAMDGGRRLVIRTVHDENARALRMHAGRADLVVNGFSPTLLPALEHAPGVSVGARHGANVTYLLPRTDRGVLADARVRRAIAAAIDRERIARSLFAGRAIAATSLLPPLHWAHSPVDGSGARSGELPESRLGGVGGRSPLTEIAPRADLHGVKLSLLSTTDRLRGTLARTIAQELGDAGAEIEVVPLELGTLLARLGAGDFELAMLTLPELTEPNVLRIFLHSASIPPSGANRGRVHDAELDRLLDDGDGTLDPATRKTIYAEVERRVRDEALFIPLWHEDQVWVASERARAFVPSAEGRWLSLATLK
jgi:peptide/nickel transport system substrate-binding protein